MHVFHSVMTSCEIIFIKSLFKIISDYTGMVSSLPLQELPISSEMSS